MHHHHPPLNLHLPRQTQTQINRITASSAPQQQQVMPSNHHHQLQGYSNNSLLNSPQLSTCTIDPARIPNCPIFTPLLPPPFMKAPNHQPFALNSVNLAPNMNAQFSRMSQFIPVQTPPHYNTTTTTTHFLVPGYRPSQISMGTPPQNASFVPRQQFVPGPIYPLPQQALNFQPIFIYPQNPVKMTLSEGLVHQNSVISLSPRGGKYFKRDWRNQKALPFSEKSKRGHSREEQKQVDNRLKWNSARSGGGADEHNNKMKGKNTRRKKQQKKKESEAPTAGVNAADTEKYSTKDAEKLMYLETESAKTKDNLVLRKLLRGPRYFDPLESWGEVCRKCGNEDHKTTYCNMQKRKRPCFICGRFDYSGKHWKKRKGSFNCNLRHLLNDCLEKDPKADENYRICLRCGDSGHSMFSCKNDYSSDDLKQIKCYICNEFGHLCCAEYVDEKGPRQVSCYKCGELGHLGPGCLNRHGNSVDSKAASLCNSSGEKGRITIDCQKNDKEDDECIGGDLAATVETYSKDKK